MTSARTSQLSGALPVLLLLLGCARPTPSPSAPASAVIDASPKRQIDWLPSDASLVMYLDGEALRSSGLYDRLKPLLPDHEARLGELLARLDSLRIAAVMHGTEPAVAGLFHGDFDDASNPSLLTQDSFQRVRRDGHDVMVRDPSGDHWFRTPEGFWVVCEPALWSSVSSPPEARPARLGDRAFALAPGRGELLFVSAEMSPFWRDELGVQLHDPMAVAMFMPVIDEIRSASLLVVPRGANLDVTLNGVFASPRGAQAAGFLLQAGVMAARAEAQETGPELPTEPARVGQRMTAFLVTLLDRLDVQIRDSHVAATLAVREADVASLGVELGAR